ncbi:ABC transporter permease subunit, partial [Brucella intermedia]
MTHSAIQPEAVNDVGKMRALRDFWFYFSVNRGAVIGLFVFLAIILVAILAPLIAPHGPTDQFREFLKTPPFWEDGGTTQFLLGTDEVGRDILSRLIYGAQYSLLVGFVIVIISMCLGITIGLITGYFGGGVDTVFMRIMDVILAFPSLLLALVLVAILGPGLINAVLAITLVLLPHFSRLTRAAVMAEKEREYVTAAKLAGASKLRLMFKTILPNCLHHEGARAATSRMALENDIV